MAGGPKRSVYRARRGGCSPSSGRWPSAPTFSLFVSEAEAALFREAGRPGADIRALSNGIDLDFYDPDAAFAPLAAPQRPADRLHRPDGLPPNVAGARAFARNVMPAIRKLADARFAIVGRRPHRDVRALDGLTA